MAETIEIKNNNQFSDAIALGQHIVYKKYFSELSQYLLVDPNENLLDEKPDDYLRFFRLKELVYKKGEDIFQKLSTVYHASMSLGGSLIVLIDAQKINTPAEIYIGVRNSSENGLKKNNLIISSDILEGGIRSNFPGTKLDPIGEGQTPKLVDNIFCKDMHCISSVSCVASVRDKSKTENKNFIQGLEHFMDAMQGNTYKAVFIAQPISADAQALMRDGYETLYSTLSSFHKSTWLYSENESKAVMESLSNGISESVTRGSSHTQAHTVSVGINVGANSSKSNSDAKSNAKQSPTKPARVGNVLVGLGDTMNDISN